MLKIISKLFYVSLFTAIIYSLIIGNIFETIKVNKNIVYIILILLIPIFDNLFEYIKSDSKFSIDFKNDFLFKIITFFIVLGFIIFTKDFSFVNIIIISSLFLGIIFAIDERYYFLTSLILLVYVIIFLLLGDKKLAELFSINVYYFLVIGVIVSITNSTLNKNIHLKNKNDLEKGLQKIKKYTNKLNLEKIIYISFLIYWIISLIFLYIGKFDFIKYFSIILISIYGLLKIFGFKFSLKNEKYNIKDLNIWKWFLSISIFGIIFTKLFLNINFNFFHYSIFSLFIINIIIFIYIFFINNLLKK